MLGCIQPMSSPMMNRMLGFFASCACALAGRHERAGQEQPRGERAERLAGSDGNLHAATSRW